MSNFICEYCKNELSTKHTLQEHIKKCGIKLHYYKTIHYINIIKKQDIKTDELQLLFDNQPELLTNSKKLYNLMESIIHYGKKELFFYVLEVKPTYKSNLIYHLLNIIDVCVNCQVFKENYFKYNNDDILDIFNITLEILTNDENVKKDFRSIIKELIIDCTRYNDVIIYLIEKGFYKQTDFNSYIKHSYYKFLLNNN